MLARSGQEPVVYEEGDTIFQAGEADDMAYVVKTGTVEIRNADGSIAPLSVKPGDTVLLADYRGDEIKFEDEEYVLLREVCQFIQQPLHYLPP